MNWFKPKRVRKTFPVMTETAILTVYRFAYPRHHQWIMERKKWKATTMLFWGMRQHRDTREAREA